MKAMKKVLALVLGCAMLIGLLVGCNGNKNDTTDSGSNDKTVAEISGTILLNANACVNITFDNTGKVLNVQEVDHDGHELLADYSGYLGLSCAEVVQGLVAESYRLEFLNSEFNYVIIKEQPSSKLPSETFLSDLADAAKQAIELSVSVTVITAADQDADGNILAKKAYDLLQDALHVEKFDLLESNEELIDGVYTFNVAAEHLEGVYLVEAATGYVYEGSFESVYTDTEETEAHEADEEVTTVETTEATHSIEETTLPQETSNNETIANED